MKCEICHRAEAQTVLVRETDGGEAQELYVCHECKRRAQAQHQKRSARTRKVSGLPPGVEVSVTEIGNGNGNGVPPSLVSALMNAFEGMVGGLGKSLGDKNSEDRKSARDVRVRKLDAARAEPAYRLAERFHLEGLSLIGELDAVKRAFVALDLQLEPVEADGVRDAGHAYRVVYTGTVARARRVVQDLLREERNARVRLLEEMPRVLGDAVCRSLAILKNCRLLAPGELFDLLSPLRLAALKDLLDGITLQEIDRLAESLALEESGEDARTQEERDALDATRADEMNARFEDVVLNEHAEEKFL